MDITPTIVKGQQLITGYGNGGFKINGEFVAGSRLVLPGESLVWAVNTAKDITVESFVSIISRDGGIELLLIGTGKTMTPLDPAIHAQLKAHHIAVEAMDTGAACRTYNVLLAEGRKVAATLIAV